MESFIQDLRYAARMFVKNPGFTAVAIIALALGIGANSAIFSVVNSVLLRPLPYDNPERLMMLNHFYPKLDLVAGDSVPGYFYYKDHSKSFEEMSCFSTWAANLTGTGDPERLAGLLVTANFFPVLGVTSAKGRLITPDENQIGRDHVVILGDGLWKRRFGGDPGLVGKTIQLNGENYTVVGITPPGFQFGSELGRPTEIWAPISFTPQQMQPNRWRNEFLTIVAKLKPGISFKGAQADMDKIADDVRKQYFQGQDASDASSWGLQLQPFTELVVGKIRTMLFVLLGAVAFVLLIACANVANLLLARAAIRQKEISIRTALGASRMRVIRQLLSESVMLALAGGILGLLIGKWGVELLLTLDRSNIPRAKEIGLDFRVVGFTFAVSMLTGVLFGLVPAIQASKNDLNHSLKEGGRSGVGDGRKHFRSALVVAEMALALVLLIGAGLLIRSFMQLQQVDPGFQPNGLLTMQISLPATNYPDAPKIDAFFEQTVQGVRDLPGVQSAAVCSVVPMNGSLSSASFIIEGRNVGPDEMAPWGNQWYAGPGYFETMKIPLLKGRFFRDSDGPDATKVAIIDENMKRKFWPDEDPIGKRIQFNSDAQGNIIWREIVGVVAHVKHKGLEGDSPVQYYLPQRQFPLRNMFLVVKTSTEPTAMTTSVRGVIREMDRNLPVFRVTTMDQIVADSMSQRRFAMLLLGIFAGIAMLLAAVGLYGVMAYSVSQRTHEIGIRIALGATTADVLRLIVGHGMLLAIIGVAIGLIGGFMSSMVIRSMLFNVSAFDPLTFVAIPTLLTIIALLATFVPARRASKVEPMTALHYE